MQKDIGETGNNGIQFVYVPVKAVQAAFSALTLLVGE